MKRLGSLIPILFLAVMALLTTNEACSQGGTYLRRDTVDTRVLQTQKLVLVYGATKPTPIANAAILWIPGPGRCYMIYGNGSESNLDSVGAGGGGGSGTGDTTFTINVSGFPQIRDSVQLISNAILTWSINGHNLTLLADTLLYLATQFDISLKADKATTVTAAWGVNAAGNLGALTIVGDSSEVATKYDLTLRALLNHTHNTSELVAGILGVARGGTGRASITSGALVAGNGAGTVNEIAVGSLDNVLASDGVAWRNDLRLIRVGEASMNPSVDSVFVSYTATTANFNCQLAWLDDTGLFHYGSLGFRPVAGSGFWIFSSADEVDACRIRYAIFTR